MLFAYEKRPECPACCSSDRVTLIDRALDDEVIGPLLNIFYGRDPIEFEGGRYQVVECKGCSTIYHAQVGGNSLLTALYDVWLNEDFEVSDSMDWLITNPRQSMGGHEIMTAAALTNSPVASLKTLDFGMGKAHWARIAKGLGCHSYGSDLSPTRMENARNHGVSTVTLAEIPGQMFDFINTEQVMEHVTETAPIMEALARGLRPGGLLKISVPSQGNIRSSLSAVANGAPAIAKELVASFPLEHVNTFSAKGLEQLGARFGLRTVKPGFLSRIAFIKNPANWLLGRPANTAKEIVRPFIPYENQKNLTVWFRA